MNNPMPAPTSPQKSLQSGRVSLTGGAAGRSSGGAALFPSTEATCTFKASVWVCFTSPSMT